MAEYVSYSGSYGENENSPFKSELHGNESKRNAGAYWFILIAMFVTGVGLFMFVLPMLGCAGIIIAIFIVGTIVYLIKYVVIPLLIVIIIFKIYKKYYSKK